MHLPVVNSGNVCAHELGYACARDNSGNECARGNSNNACARG